MASGISYKQAKLAEQWDAIVIGSGIGGLTAAVLLGADAGKRVLVLERHYEVGGFTHTFHRPGYEWDVGLHYIGQMQDTSSAVRRAFDHVTEDIRSIMSPDWSAFGKDSNNRSPATLEPSTGISRRSRHVTV